MIAEGEMKDRFLLSGRSEVVVLKEDFRGKIFGNGIIESVQGTTDYRGPEFVDRIRDQKSWIAVTVDPSVTA
jgi:hypothetical protein